MKKEIGILGLGSMGTAIALNLKKNTKFLVTILINIIRLNLLKIFFL